MTKQKRTRRAPAAGPGELPAESPRFKRLRAVYEDGEPPISMTECRRNIAVVAASILQRTYSLAQEPLRSKAGLHAIVSLGEDLCFLVAFTDYFSVFVYFIPGTTEIKEAQLCNILQENAFFNPAGKGGMLRGEELMTALRADEIIRITHNTSWPGTVWAQPASAEGFQGGDGI